MCCSVDTASKVKSLMTHEKIQGKLMRGLEEKAVSAGTTAARDSEEKDGLVVVQAPEESTLGLEIQILLFRTTKVGALLVDG